MIGSILKALDAGRSTAIAGPRVRRVAMAGMAMLALISTSQAQDVQSGSNTTRIVIGYAPGGGNDITARIVAEKLSKNLGRPFIVENKPGAASRLAAEYVMKQPPDGRVLLVSGNSAISMAAAIYPDLGYRPLEDFVPITVLADYPPLVLLVPKNHPANSLGDLIKWSKANPDASNYAAVAQAYTIPTEVLKLKSGLVAVPIPFRSSSEALVAIVGDKLTFMLADSTTGLSAVAQGQVKALAVTGSARMKELPNIPSMGELGYPDVKIDLWTGMFAPKGTPQQIVTTLATEVDRVLKDPDVMDKLAKLGLIPGAISGAAYGQKLAAEIQYFRDVIKETKLTFE